MPINIRLYRQLTLCLLDLSTFSASSNFAWGSPMNLQKKKINIAIICLQHKKRKKCSAKKDKICKLCIIPTSNIHRQTDKLTFFELKILHPKFLKTETLGKLKVSNCLLLCSIVGQG